MWIETSIRRWANNTTSNSFTSNGECGLKRAIWHHGCPAPCGNSFASNGECGLKPLSSAHAPGVPAGNSFASNGECGLKRRAGGVAALDFQQFIRQQWRMWIETARRANPQAAGLNSFASNGECGLKPQTNAPGAPLCLIHSPAMANVD